MSPPTSEKMGDVLMALNDARMKLREHEYFNRDALALVEQARAKVLALSLAAAPANEWRPIETYNDEWPIRIRAPELVDLDFNEAGETDACALCDPEWYAAKWNNSQDVFETIRVNPTHWRPL